jgi:hypothetical protein
MVTMTTTCMRRKEGCERFVPKGIANDAAELWASGRKLVATHTAIQLSRSLAISQPMEQGIRYPAFY